MNSKLMRQIDYRVGIPLCFLLNMFDCILKIVIFKKRKETVPEKILFTKLAEMGSIILAYPLVKQVKKEYAKAEIFFVTFKKNKPIFEILAVVPQHNVLSIREESLWFFILDTLKIIKYLRKKKIDVAFDLEFFSRFTAIFNYLNGASKRIGFYRYNFEGLYRGNLLTHKVQYNPLIHISKSYFSFWQTIKLEEKSAPELEMKITGVDISLPKFALTEEAKRLIWRKLKEMGIDGKGKLLLINPGDGKLPLREWPLENFIILGKNILEDRNNYLIVVGTQEASQKTKLLCKTINNARCIDLISKTTLSEILALFNIAEVLITNDCGLAHLSSLTPIKKIVLFGPESPQIYAPLGENTWTIYSDLPCSPCFSALNQRNSACKNNKCLKKISVGEVYNLVKKCLNEYKEF